MSFLGNILSHFGNNALTYDIVLAVLFIGFFVRYLYLKRKNLSFEKMAFPLFYAFLHRDKYGIAWMKKAAKKHKGLIILIGYIAIGIGFVGMFLALWLIFETARQLIFVPSATSVAPFLPFVNVPVLGYISFSHWIITLFIIVIVHEAAHGLVALAHGLRLKHTGFGIFAIIIPFIPLAFVEPDDKQIKKQSDVIQHSIYAAGPMANFLLAIPLLLIIFFVVAPIESRMTDVDGFTFDVIEGLPVAEAGIENETRFNTVNSIPMTAQEFVSYMRWQMPQETLRLSYVQDGEIIHEFEIQSTEHPDDPTRGFIGVQGIRAAVTILPAAEPYAPAFSWFKGLINLLFVITISLGVINLFPAAITDGGQMLRVALKSTINNERAEQAILSALALVFFAIILFAIITFFTGNPFALLFG